MSEFETLAEMGVDKDYKQAENALTVHFTPKVMQIMRLLFRNLAQEQDKSFDEYC